MKLASKDFKIRCSAIGKIMGNLSNITEKQLLQLDELQSKLKRTEKQESTLKELIIKRDTPSELSQTAKSYCETWLKEQLYKRRIEFSSKYTRKGLIMEDNSIDFIAEQLGYGFLIKNDEKASNDFMTGECDIMLPDLIIDAKNSWDFSTFPLFETEIPNKDYYGQGQGYMELYGRDHYKLIYTLMNTPESIIEKEAFYWCKNNGYDDLDEDILEQFLYKMTYDDIPDNLKIKVFSFDRDQEYIDRIKQQVVKCRDYIETLIIK